MISNRPHITLSNPAFTSANFIYDGDGKRVKSILNGNVTTYFVGGHYEVANGTVTKYYYAGSQRIAMRQNGTLNYILGDHLGSTSLTTDANGQVISEMKYKAWGETRYASGTTPTKYTYTGQYSYVADFGLHFYNARWYDSSLSRFAQADTITPKGVQGLDRYTYVNNSPIRFTDPSGHYACDDRHDCETRKSTACSVGSGVFNGNFTCTPDDLNKASISQRQSWFKGMLNFADPDLAAEFRNINGILASFRATDTGTPGTWASWGDAGILVSIQNGLYMSENEIDKPISTNPYGTAADTAWKDYFDSFRENRFSTTTDQLWGVAEGAGTTYGNWLAQQHGQTPSVGESAFLKIGDLYRTLLANKIGPEVTETWPGFLKTVYAGYDWFLDPSSTIPVGDIPPVSFPAFFLLQK